MSSVVLDTHALVWLLAGDRRLSPAVAEVVQQAADTNHAFVSAITPWEIAMLVSKGKLTFACDVQTWLDDALSLPGITLAPLLPVIAVDSVRSRVPAKSSTVRIGFVDVNISRKPAS